MTELKYKQTKEYKELLYNIKKLNGNIVDEFVKCQDKNKRMFNMDEDDAMYIFKKYNGKPMFDNLGDAEDYLDRKYNSPFNFWTYKELKADIKERKEKLRTAQYKLELKDN